MPSENHQVNIVRCNPHKPEDFTKLEDAFLKLFNENENLIFLSLSNVPFDSNTISTFLKSYNLEEMAFCAALSPENNIIGISTFENDLMKGFQVLGVVVADDYRHQGIGRALIDKGVEIAREKGYKAIDISVFADNKAMLILLLKMDFKIIKIDYHARHDGEDLIQLKRYL